jgi:AcrR family transcriptional regulator
MAIDCQAQLQLTALAERSGSSIGALYNYFPDKQSIAFTLVNQYAQELEAHWKPMMEQSEILTHAEFADICSSSASPNSRRSVPLI